MKFVKITDGVFGCLNLNTGNFYLIKNQNNNILIDCGARSYNNKLEKFFSYCNILIEDITHVFITHGDGDHIGNLYKFSGSEKVNIFIGELTYSDYLNKKIPRHFPAIITFLMTLRTFNKIDNLQFANINFLKNKELIDLAGGFEVIYTPGHTDDHYSFYYKSKKILFTGDILYGKNGSYILPPKIINTNNLQIKNSRKKILMLNPRIVATGHGEVIYK